MNDFVMLIEMLKDKTPYKISDKDAVENYKNICPNAVIGLEIQNTLLKKGKIGYTCFLSQWLFDAKGNFIAVGHYEN